MANINRRKFIRQASCAAVGTTTFLSTMLNLKTLNAASILNSTVNAQEDYKALVCLFMSGGNDSYNMLIPRDNGTNGAVSLYNTYKASRSNLALPFNSLLNLNHVLPGATPFGLNPSLPKVASLYGSGKLAFVSNVGTLVEPVATRSQLENNTKEAPLGLYSHSDQGAQWQTGIPNDRSAVGWAGKIADMLQSVNTNDKISMNISLSGTNVMQTGNNTVEFAIDPENGSIGIYGDNDDWLLNQVTKSSLNSLFADNYQDIFKKAYTKVIKNSREGNEILQTQLSVPTTYTTPFPETYLGNAFKMVANVIAKRSGLGMKRQIFFIDYGGWDHHDEVIAAQTEMFTEVDNALHAFNAAMNQLTVSDLVTTFSVSEFSRTLTSNGNGTDHGWGGNVMVMGGNVDGGKMFGTYPSLSLNSTIDLGGGVLIPSTSTDAYFAELALWYGVPPSELSTLFPNIGNFYNTSSGVKPVGFMKTI
ncbi:MAG: DUF1501 domain-containing protein [Saprospiraceae bacterium]|nr:DUF1501 domain-containing protein [Saprospiraceae bacterium]